MAYDYSKLKGRIVEKYETRSNFAKAMCVSTHSLSKKLNGRTPFRQSEISRACELLCIEAPQISEYFFTQLVQ